MKKQVLAILMAAATGITAFRRLLGAALSTGKTERIIPEKPC